MCRWSQLKTVSFDNLVTICITSRALILPEIGNALFSLRDVDQHSGPEWLLKCQSSFVPGNQGKRRWLA